VSNKSLWPLKICAASGQASRASPGEPLSIDERI
jgi:hypothetical protein